VDRGQEGKKAHSIAILAKKQNMPGWFVQLRHDAAHGNLPSLAMLLYGGEKVIER
jgi:hypothetical protein